MPPLKLIPLSEYREYPAAEMQQRAADFYADIRRRRTVRDFSDRPVPREIIETCLLAAGTAPSGANQQPWHFALVSDSAIKKQIREAAEEEEKAFYSGRAGEEWLDALSHLGTDWEKPFLETAPYLIVIFAQTYGLGADGKKIKHYYATESVGIASSRRAGFADAYAQSNGLFAPNPQSPAQRKTLPHSGCWLSGKRRAGSGHF